MNLIMSKIKKTLVNDFNILIKNIFVSRDTILWIKTVHSIHKTSPRVDRERGAPRGGKMVQL